jgi:hypothetical protein
MSIFHSHLRAPARGVLSCRCEVSTAAIKSAATSPLSDCYYHFATRSPPPNAARSPSIAPMPNVQLYCSYLPPHSNWPPSSSSL